MLDNEKFKSIFANTPVIIILSVAILALSIVIGCCVEFMRKYGLIIFIIFTVLFSLFVGIACALSKPYLVFTAAGITCLIVVSLTAFACKY